MDTTLLFIQTRERIERYKATIKASQARQVGLRMTIDRTEVLIQELQESRQRLSSQKLTRNEARNNNV